MSPAGTGSHASHQVTGPQFPDHILRILRESLRPRLATGGEPGFKLREIGFPSLITPITPLAVPKTLQKSVHYPGAEHSSVVELEHKVVRALVQTFVRRTGEGNHVDTLLAY